MTVVSSWPANCVLVLVDPIKENLIIFDWMFNIINSDMPDIFIYFIVKVLLLGSVRPDQSNAVSKTPTLKQSFLGPWLWLPVVLGPVWTLALFLPPFYMVLSLTFVVSSPLLHIGRLYLPCRPSSPDSGSCLQPGNGVGSWNSWHLPKITNLQSLSKASVCLLCFVWVLVPKTPTCFVCFIWFLGGVGGYFDQEQELHQVPKCSVLFDKMYLATEATALLPRHRTVQF